MEKSQTYTAKAENRDWLSARLSTIGRMLNRTFGQDSPVIVDAHQTLEACFDALEKEKNFLTFCVETIDEFVKELIDKDDDKKIKEIFETEWFSRVYEKAA